MKLPLFLRKHFCNKTPVNEIFDVQHPAYKKLISFFVVLQKNNEKFYKSKYILCVFTANSPNF